MSLYTDLQTITLDSQNREISAQNTYMDIAGPIDIKTFLTGQAQLGKTTARFHVEKDANPHRRETGYQSLSGQHGRLKPEPARGVIERNDIGWFYFNMATTTLDQFTQEVTDLTNYLTAEGLTVTEVAVGATMADFKVSWA